MRYQILQIDNELFKGINLVLKDAQGCVLGGIVGKTNDNRESYIEHLWIEEAYRGQKLGTELLRSFEQIAQKQGCEKVFVDTFDFQTPIFYEKNDYQLSHTHSPSHAGYTRFYYYKIF